MTGKITGPVHRRSWRAAFSGILVGLALLAMPFTGAVADHPPHWAATWATASKTITPFDAPLPAINDTTNRQEV
ncbi:MAG: hypothetical protein F4Z84_03005, partial [Gammaproteobacteria bacterium]|nr:hypothetical protein [Gammaproteobacteria bacterium]